MPTGVCWCGCGNDQIALGSFFAPGHDKRAASKVIMEVFGSVPDFLVAMGYGPDTSDHQRRERAATVRVAIERAGLAVVVREMVALVVAHSSPSPSSPSLPSSPLSSVSERAK